VEPESIDEFERELRQALERRPAPPSLKRRIMQQRSARRTGRMHSHTVLWRRLAASLVISAMLGGALEWRHAAEQRKGEEARRQVLTALRITSHALNNMSSKLAAHNQADQ
jgi:hypothetical protein